MIQGTGLGLSIVRGIAKHHGREVTMESAAGVGTTVELVTPLSTLGTTAAAQQEG